MAPSPLAVPASEAAEGALRAAVNKLARGGPRPTAAPRADLALEPVGPEIRAALAADLS